MIVAKNIKIRPANPQDKQNIFNWLANSNLTSEMLGPPKFPDAKIPSWEEFLSDYPDYFFTGSEPLKGQCFVITYNSIEVGQINHDVINTIGMYTYLDIWLSDKKYTGKGIGTVAIKLICNYLHDKFNCKEIRIAPSKRNLNAIKAYKKAGFVMTDIQLDEPEMDYEDNVVLVKKLVNE